MNATTNKTGLEFVMKVMAGDVIDIMGKSYYVNTTNITNANSTTLDVLGLMTNFLTAPANAAAGKGFTAGILNTANSGVIPNSFFRGNNSEPTTTIPKAYINYIFFDEQFNYKGGGFSRVGATSGSVWDHWQNDPALQNLVAPKNGYIFVYVSNESNLDVFFDNLQVIHKPGPILEETHYYPFGLTMGGISSKSEGSLANNKKWNAGSELNTNFDINLYETQFRSLDPQLGRFWQIDPRPNLEMSPYCSMGNNPILLNDPLGDTTRIMIGDQYYNLQRNKDGGISFYDNNGKMYNGKLDEFSQSVLTTVNSIAGIKDEEVQSRLTEVLGGTKMITVMDGLQNFDGKTGDLSWFDNKAGNRIMSNNGGNIEKDGPFTKVTRDSDLEFIHEWLGHGFQYSKGMLNHDRILPFTENGRLIGWPEKVEADAATIVTRAAEASGRPQMGQPVYIEDAKRPDGTPIQRLFHVIPRGYLLTNSESQKPPNYRR
ncbi:RHS repeat-associated core domain-containing protein [Ferruginibacter sp. HRS2-29]|uniref:RHS repeat-associated core domain-containing protein n=1 Tax=Ferruginibacter sp. HRS2-29 TaxID=2487334 RepID=UPI0020CBF65D|nr:RHS repeat-associated core domain-containing protein [Ferruginibacter sp. HRS2-29]MCP9750049.1 hypothetical protein [Ferruginibacter sp. HRS2-29]